MKTWIIQLTYLIFILSGCNSRNPDEEVTIKTPEPSRREERNLYSYLVEIYHERIINADSIMEDFMHQPSTFVHDTDLAHYGIIECSYKDSINYQVEHNLPEIAETSIDNVQIRIELCSLLNSTTEQFMELQLSIEKIDYLLYPSSAKWGYSERNFISNYLFFQYLKHDVGELIYDYYNEPTSIQ